MYLHVLMPQSHCAESTAKWWRFEFDRVVIPGHSSNDNDNQFEQCSHACSFGCTHFVYPARIIFIPAYAHWKLVVIVFVA